ncbi:MAG: alpha-amylase family glycosyl hydrolase [Thalassotalea sp.]
MNNNNSWGRVLLSSMLACSLAACSQDDAKTLTKNTDHKSTLLTSVPIKNKLSTASDLTHYLNRPVEDEVFYFVLPDRFENGDPNNDQGSKTIALSQGGFDPSNKAMYHGGDIQGLKDKLPYIKNMGVSAIWLTPIMRNRALQGDSSGYHGYWILDFTEIDPHLGSNEELKAFIDAAHQENIKVYFDIIANHTADVIRYKECHLPDGTPLNDCTYRSLAEVEKLGTYTPYLPTGSENVKAPAWLNNPKYYHNQGETTYQGENSIYGDFASLDDINTDDPEVVKGMIEIFKGVVSEFKPDGFRIDTVKHVNLEFWQEFSPAIVAHARESGIPQFFMFGEVYDPSPDVLSKFTGSGKMQSVLDFGFQDAIDKTLIKQQGTDVFKKLFDQDHKYNDQDSHANRLLNFVGNHDMGRMAFMLNNSEFNYSEAEKIKRVLLGHALMYFARGIPVIYYGDEQGFVGDGNDQGARQNMMPSKVDSFNDDDLLATDKTTADENFDESHLFYRAFAQYADLYFNHQALRHGKQAIVHSQSSPGLLAFTRTLGNDKFLIVANTDVKAINKSIAVKTKTSLVFAEQPHQHQASAQDGSLAIKLPALSFAIYQLK